MDINKVININKYDRSIKPKKVSVSNTISIIPQKTRPKYKIVKDQIKQAGDPKGLINKILN